MICFWSPIRSCCQINRGRAVCGRFLKKNQSQQLLYQVAEVITMSVYWISLILKILSGNSHITCSSDQEECNWSLRTTRKMEHIIHKHIWWSTSNGLSWNPLGLRKLVACMESGMHSQGHLSCISPSLLKEERVLAFRSFLLHFLFLSETQLTVIQILSPVVKATEDHFSNHLLIMATVVTFQHQS